MNNSRLVTYTKDDKEIVRKGIVAIQDILMGTDANRKRSLLFCLDWFMDPFYKQDISEIHDELVDLLQNVIISSDEDDIREDALGLLISYAWPPFEILEKNMDCISSHLRGNVLYAINMDKEES